MSVVMAKEMASPVVTRDSGLPEPKMGGKAGGGLAGKMGMAMPAMAMPMPSGPMSYRKLMRWSAMLVRMSFGSFVASTLATLATTLLTQYSIQLLSDILSGLQGRATDAIAVRNEAFFYVGVIVLVLAMNFGGKVLTGWSDSRMVMRLQQRLHDKLLRLGAGFHDRHEMGELTSVVLQSTGGAQQMLRDLASFPVLRGIPMATAIWFLARNFGAIRSMSVGADVVIGVVLLALPLVGSRLSGRLQLAAGASQQAQSDLNSEFINSVGQPLEVQVLGAQRQRAAAFGERLRRMAAAKVATTLRLTMATQFGAAMPMVLQTIFLVYAVLVLVQSGSGAIGSILAIYYFVPQVIGPVQDLLSFSIGLNATWPIIAPVGELLDAEPPRQTGQVALPEGGAVALDNVGLRYGEGGRAVLDGLSHVFAPGRISAIVGRSGSGKSTILGLINGMRAPTQGIVSLGGVPVGSILPDALRQRVVTVSQFPLFVADTVRTNFLLAKDDASDAEIEEVCRKTGLWPVLVAGSPGAPLDAMMSRVAGQGLSGGERRLFAITRALLRRPGVLLLDEPTTGIDRLAVQMLAERLPGLLEGLTVVIVEHDMSFVERIAGEVCCLEDGRFAEVGSPAELASRPSLFQRLRAAQQSLATTSGLTIESIPLPSLTTPTTTAHEG